MDIPRWTPSQTVSKPEQYLLSRLKRTRKLFAFLRLHRDELFDETFQAELATMYRSTGAGKAPCPPALLAMASLLQGYLEHGLAHVVARQGDQARYRGVRKNLYDLRRTAAIGNLEVLQRTGQGVVPLREQRSQSPARRCQAAA